ncbi:MAG TPA: hypothetical protein VFT34_01125 [Verrucomicrobiae bacterium]|nr:hypothetical protein [Verrucomicrobiae bacterium]
MKKFSASHRSALSWICFVLALCSARVWAASLTSVMIFSCDSSGNPAGNFIWDTRDLSSDFYKVWLTRGTPQGEPDGLVGGFINGPSWGAAPINLVLEEGTNQFTVFFQYNGDWPAFALHLFLESNTVATISAKAPLRTGETIPEFTPNSAPRTYSLTSYPMPDAPAAGTTSVQVDRSVELTEYYVANTDLFELDRVSTHSAVTNGHRDYVGTFTLVAGPRRPPTDRQIRVQIYTTEVTLCWASEAGGLYQAQYSTSAPDLHWTDIGVPIRGNGTTNCVADRVHLGAGHRLYRVVELE